MHVREGVVGAIADRRGLVTVAEKAGCGHKKFCRPATREQPLLVALHELRGLGRVLDGVVPISRRPGRPEQRFPRNNRRHVDSRRTCTRGQRGHQRLAVVGIRLLAELTGAIENGGCLRLVVWRLEGCALLDQEFTEHLGLGILAGEKGNEAELTRQQGGVRVGLVPGCPGGGGLSCRSLDVTLLHGGVKALHVGRRRRRVGQCQRASGGKSTDSSCNGH